MAGDLKREELLAKLRTSRQGRSFMRDVVLPWFWGFGWLRTPVGVPRTIDGHGLRLDVAYVIPALVVSGGPGRGPYLVELYPDGARQDDGTAAQPAEVRGELYLVGDVATTYQLAAGTWLEVRAAGAHYEASLPVSSAIPARVAAKISGQVYACDFFEGGPPPTTSTPPTRTGVQVTLFNVSAAETYAANAWVTAYPWAVGPTAYYAQGAIWES